MIAWNFHLLLLILMVPIFVLLLGHFKLKGLMKIAKSHNTVLETKLLIAHLNHNLSNPKTLSLSNLLKTKVLIAHLNHNLSNPKTLSQSNLLKTKVLHLPHPKKHILGLDALQIMLLMIAVNSQLLLLILMVPMIVLSFSHGKLKWLINLAKDYLSLLETKLLIDHLKIDLLNWKIQINYN